MFAVALIQRSFVSMLSSAAADLLQVKRGNQVEISSGSSSNEFAKYQSDIAVRLPLAQMMYGGIAIIVSWPY